MVGATFAIGMELFHFLNANQKHEEPNQVLKTGIFDCV